MSLTSQGTTLFQVGTSGEITYGWNHLTGTAPSDSGDIGVDLLGNVQYTNGVGPIFGFVTLHFASLSDVGFRWDGKATKGSGGATDFSAKMKVIGGNAALIGVKGGGTFTGSRAGALGSPVELDVVIKLGGSRSASEASGSGAGTLRRSEPTHGAEVTAFDPGDIRAFNEQLVEEFRANDGVLSGGFADVPMLLLTTTGAKTGRPHTIPIVYGRDGDRYFVIASKAGARTNPAWYHNVVANPGVTVELPGDTFVGRAAVADPETRARLYAQQSGVMPQFTEYQERTDRVIPVILLSRT